VRHDESKNVIAAGDKVTAEAAQETLWLGGNAFDGAVAAVFAAMVSESTLTSAGGGGCFLASPIDRTPSVFDFFVNMPSREVVREQLDFFGISVDFGTTEQEFHVGKGSVAIPGNIAGLLHVQEQLGRLPLVEVLSPAIRVARQGVTLSDRQAYLVKILAPILTHDEPGRDLYSPEGTLLSEGDLLVMSKFADFLTALGKEGADLFYRGEAARIILEWAEEGGLIQQSDLVDYRVHEREPLKTRFNGYEVLLNPPPAQSGVLIDIALALLERRRQTSSAITLCDLAFAFDVTNQFRVEKAPFGPPSGLKFPVSETTLFEEYLDRFDQRVGRENSPEEPQSGGSTTHVSVLDKEGNAASVTTTNGEGCGYVLPELGFMLNNMLGEEDLNPKGFFRYRAGTRLSSMVAPTVVRKNGRPILLTGTAGSNRIRSVIVQLLINSLFRGMSIEEATRAPRVHLEGHTLHCEPEIPEQELSELPEKYQLHRWQEQNLFFGGANSATCHRGTGDPRRGGIGLVLD
jgi:gamma-glutamyltranspeptidase/glutathione hydrolase